MDTTSLVPELSLGEFRTVTRQVGRPRNGTNREAQKESKVKRKPKPNVKAKATLLRAAGLGSNSNLKNSVHSSSKASPVSDGKPTYVNPDEPKLATKSGRIPHSPRPSVSDSHGVHVTVKLKGGIPNLRQKHVIEALERCFCKAKDRFEFELTAYTVMSNHLHFLVYVRSNQALRRGMQGLNIRIARTINRLFNREGKVFADRFHARVIRGWNAIRKALRYVVQNARKHQVSIPSGQWDRYSSGHYRHARTTKTKDMPILHACGSYLIQCATLQLLPSEFPGPHNRADPIH